MKYFKTGLLALLDSALSVLLLFSGIIPIPLIPVDEWILLGGLIATRLPTLFDVAKRRPFFTAIVFAVLLIYGSLVGSTLLIFTGADELGIGFLAWQVLTWGLEDNRYFPDKQKRE